MIDRRIKQLVNVSYSMKDVLKYYTGYAPIADTLRCCFHDDHRKSAKIYHNEDGDRIYCFTENKQYTVCDLIELYGGDINDWVTPEMKLQEIVIEDKELNFSPLEGFKKGEFGIEEVFLRTIQLKGK